MKKGIKILIILGIIITVLGIALIPIRRNLKDGGTVEYNALLYSVHHVNSLDADGVNVGTRVRVLFWTVIDDVHFEMSDKEIPPVEEKSVAQNPDAVLLRIAMNPGGEMTREEFESGGICYEVLYSGLVRNTKNGKENQLSNVS